MRVRHDTADASLAICWQHQALRFCLWWRRGDREDLAPAFAYRARGCRSHSSHHLLLIDDSRTLFLMLQNDKAPSHQYCEHSNHCETVCVAHDRRTLM